jgi:hypothetical protein
MHFSLRPFEIKGRVLDTSFKATHFSFLPDSLGLRTQALTLKFATPKMKASFVSPEKPFGEVMARIEKRSDSMGSGGPPMRVFHRAFIGDTVSMIYAPVYLSRGAVYDGILKRPLATVTGKAAEKLQSVDTSGDWNIQFISALCPHCGWDLVGGRDSVVLLCGNCAAAWRVTKDRFERLSFGTVPSTDRKAFYIPFWRMKVEIEGLQLASYADLIKLANLPRAMREECKKREFYFWSPAFHVPPRLFLRLAKQTTVLQPPAEFEDSIPKSSLYPATLPVDEALESVTVTLAGIAVPKKKFFPLLPDLAIRLEESVLVYLPFALEGDELIQTEMKFSINRNSMRGHLPQAMSP